MSYTPFAHAESLRIGTIDFVSPDEVKALLDVEAPDSVAMNAGSVRPFPRVNGYVLMPVDDGFLVGQIEWMTIERSAFPKRRGMQDFGLVDLPYPLRKMSLNPLGTLRKQAGLDEHYRFHRGADALPSVGSPVLLPTDKQLRSIVESGERRHVRIGTSPLAANATVSIDPDRLFGRHLAVLGNTGSGKSCSVAGLIRWSLETAKAKRRDNSNPNARFIVLDPNGEYTRAFGSEDKNIKARIFKVTPGDGGMALKVPLWFWNSAEWTSFTQASAKTQRPTLIQALRSVRDGTAIAASTPSHDMRRFLRTLVSVIQIERNAGRPWANFPHPKNFFEKIKKWQEALGNDASFSVQENEALTALNERITQFSSARSGQYPTYDFTREEIDEFLGLTQVAHAAFGGSDTDILPIDADVPREFTGDQLLRSVEANAELLGNTDHVETMLMRIRTILSDSRMKTIVSDTQGITLDAWLKDTIGEDQAMNGTVTVIDLSLVPAEVIHIVTSVIARMVLDALQRFRKQNHGKVLPTTLVMEEAHTFVKRYQDDVENQSASAICCQIFEKIAREGRKFGMGLILSSQRPSELSPTVLSQCNTFLLHRISNDRDQELVHRLVPDNLRGLLRELPSLPSQHAILLGWASELPVLVKMDELPKSQQPHSDDPDYWDVWTGFDKEGGEVKREVDWKAIADDWQNAGNSSQDEDLE